MKFHLNSGRLDKIFAQLASMLTEVLFLKIDVHIFSSLARRHFILVVNGTGRIRFVVVKRQLLLHGSTECCTYWIYENGV